MSTHRWAGLGVRSQIHSLLLFHDSGGWDPSPEATPGQLSSCEFWAHLLLMGTWSKLVPHPDGEVLIPASALTPSLCCS